MRRNRSADGFTYIEVAIILLALAILVGIFLPNIGNFNALARKVKLKEDIGVLCVSLKVMMDDLGDSAFWSSGYETRSVSYGASSGWSTSSRQTSGASYEIDSSTQFGVRADDDWCDNCNMPASQCGSHCMDDCNENCRAHDCDETCRGGQVQYASVTTQTQRSTSSQAHVGRSGSFATSSASVRSSAYGGFHGAPIGLLVGDGDVPRSAVGGTGWQLGVGEFFSETTHGYYPTALTFVVDTFANQLIHQDPTYGRYDTAAAVGWGRGGGAYGMTDTTYRWRGPYIADRITSDPWGNRYMANVFGLHAGPAIRGASVGGTYGSYVESFHSAVVCYSAGPNETIETEFNQPYGWYTGGDDVTAVLAGAGGIR